ncbi:MAG: cytidylate kinase [Flavobacteriales bacterium]|nr:MAG: cytidylate kinase [Flavobacteriales bacterium]
MNKKPVIAIDGFSSTGKSSISKEIAKRLGLIHIDTGALYRGITFFGLENYTQNNQIDIPQLIANLDQIHLVFKLENEVLSLYLNGKNIDQEIRETRVSDQVSQIAQQKEIRDFLLDTQREMAQNGGVIMDGRDIGTTILPNANYKFFMTANVEERTQRRYLELKKSGVEIDKMSVRENLITRDKIDSEREIAPLKQAKDAILIDNSSLNKQETIDLILSYIN